MGGGRGLLRGKAVIGWFAGTGDRAGGGQEGDGVLLRPR